MAAALRVLLQVVAAGLLTVGGIGLYFSIGALLAGDRVAVEAVLTTVVALTLATLLLRRLFGRRAP